MFRKILFRISFGFSRYYLMLLYKTFWNLYKTKYFLYKNRRKFRHVFSEFSGSFYADCGFFCFFLLILSLEKSVFLTRPSVNDRIYSYRPYIFHAFFGWFDKFFSFFSPFFSAFFVRLQKNLLLFHPDHPFFEIFSLHRNNFSCLFPSGTEKFFISFPYFLCFSWIFSKEKSAFSLSVTQFRTCFSLPSG